MRSTIQTINGDSKEIDQLKNMKEVIQLIQMADGSLKHVFNVNKNDKIISFKEKNGGYSLSIDQLKNINEIKADSVTYLRLKNGLFVILPNNFELLTTKNAMILTKSIKDLKKGDFIATPSLYLTNHTTIKFDPWDLDDHLYIYGIKSWYLNKLNKVMKENGLLLKDIGEKLRVPYWLIRRNASTKNSINLGYLKKFIKNNLEKNKLNEMITLSKGLKNEKSAKKIAKTPFEYNKDLAYLDGLTIGEGYIAPNEKQVIFEFSDEEYVSVLKNLFNKTHNFNARNGNRINLPGFLAYFYSKFLGVPKGKKSKIVEFPKLALLSKNDIAISALRSIIDGEGTLNIDKKNKYKIISISSSSLKLILGTISVLIRIGVSYSIRKSNKDSTWILSIKDINKLFKIIKYLKHPTKDKILNKLDKLKFGNRKVIPNLGAYIKDLRKKNNLSGIKLASLIGLSNTIPTEKSGNFYYKTLKKINKVFKDERINFMLLQNIEWHKIVYKKEIKINSKFIFPRTKSFFFVNHIPCRC